MRPLPRGGGGGGGGKKEFRLDSNDFGFYSIVQ